MALGMKNHPESRKEFRVKIVPGEKPILTPKLTEQNLRALQQQQRQNGAKKSKGSQKSNDTISGA